MNRKRTLVTIIGIILSTALMVGIGLLISTFLTSLRMSAIEDFGSFHASLSNVTKEEMQVLSKNVNIDKIYYYEPLGFALNNSTIENKPFLYVTAGSKTFLETLKLLEGTLPTNANELLISDHINYQGGKDYKVGDTITLDIGARIYEGEERDIYENYPIPTAWNNDTIIYQKEELNVKTTKTYKIVGIVENSVYEEYYDGGVMVFSLSSKIPEKLTAYIEFKNPKRTYDILQEIKPTLNNDIKININEHLLYYYGATKYNNINNTILPLILIALSVISIGCIIVIYNSFAISTMERKKSFGLYASIGATMKQIKKTVLFEAFIVGIIGIVIGLLCGFLGIYIVVQIINSLVKDALNAELIFSVDLLYLLIPLVFMILVIGISAYLPAKRSSKISPIEAIRGNDDIKISKKEVKTPKFIRKMFGIEGDIAYKNIKRNKKKYRITVISLFISIVMFNTFTSFLNYFIKSSDIFDYYDYNISINLTGTEGNVKKDYETITKKYDIDNSLFILDHNSLEANLTNNDFTSEYLENCLGTDTFNSTYLYGLVLTDREYDKLFTDEATFLNNKYITTINDRNRVTRELKVFNKDRYNLTITNDNSSATLTASVINKEIWGLKDKKYSANTIIILKESTYKEKIGFNGEFSATLNLSTKEYKDIADDLDNQKLSLQSRVNYFSPDLEMTTTKNIILAVKILFYGFISLITLIGVTSVINTINTNISLRKKEFAMLRSIGLTPHGFNKILFFESLFFGLKSLIYGIPVSMAINILISLVITNVIETSIIIPWGSILISIIAVFLIVLLTMNYASKKIKKENILESLREENI